MIHSREPSWQEAAVALGNGRNLITGIHDYVAVIDVAEQLAHIAKACVIAD